MICLPFVNKWQGLFTLSLVQGFYTSKHITAQVGRVAQPHQHFGGEGGGQEGGKAGGRGQGGGAGGRHRAQHPFDVCNDRTGGIISDENNFY